MFKKVLFAVLFLATTANVSGSIVDVKRSDELRKVVDKRQSGSIPISELPRQCQKICTPAINALNSISQKCSSATCICTKTVDSSFQGCIDCIVKIDPAGDVVSTLKQLAAEYNELCAGTKVSSLSVVVPSTTTSSTTTKTSSSKHTSTGKTSSKSTATTSTTSSSTTSTTSSESYPTSTSTPSTTIGSLTDTGSLSSATSATSFTSNSVGLTPTSTSTAIASASATSTNAAITRAKTGAQYPLMALMITFFALAF
ncbi:hypothetical protein APHAL10511_005810 [Amanita phalloides]|nr:hypothetical protein APHAL10511_005810 [Amanita phalloides]